MPWAVYLLEQDKWLFFCSSLLGRLSFILALSMATDKLITIIWSATRDEAVVVETMKASVTVAKKDCTCILLSFFFFPFSRMLLTSCKSKEREREREWPSAEFAITQLEAVKDTIEREESPVQKNTCRVVFLFHFHRLSTVKCLNCVYKRKNLLIDRTRYRRGAINHSTERKNAHAGGRERERESEKEKECTRVERKEKKRSLVVASLLDTLCILGWVRKEEEEVVSLFRLLFSWLRATVPSLPLCPSVRTCPHYPTRVSVCMSPTQNTCVKTRRIRPQWIYVCMCVYPFSYFISLVLSHTVYSLVVHQWKNWRLNRSLATEGNRYFILYFIVTVKATLSQVQLVGQVTRRQTLQFTHSRLHSDTQQAFIMLCGVESALNVFFFPSPAHVTLASKKYRAKCCCSSFRHQR